MRLPQKLINRYENLLIARGEAYFYKYAVGCGFMDREKNQRSDIVMLDTAEAFFILFRQTGNDNYFRVGRILRKAAHRLYRDRLRSMETPEINARFLYLVK